MTELLRIVRLAVNGSTGGGAPQLGGELGDGHSNGHGGSPRMVGFGRHFEIRVRCRGDLGAQTGYIVNIKVIDEVVRSHAIPILERACSESAGINPVEIVAQIFEEVRQSCPARVSALLLQLSPYYCVEMEEKTPSTVLVRQRFEFAAAHRLHVDHLSDEENRKLFGKCNNPCGHGHNYVVEPCVECHLDEAGGQTLTLGDLERLTAKHVIDSFDHRNLNLEIEEFGPNGVNPTVENIAKSCFERLTEPIAKLGGRVCLRSVTVWESDRTAATYPAL